MKIFKKQFLGIHLPGYFRLILCLENGPCVTSERGTCNNIKDFLIIKATEPQTYFNCCSC